MNNWKEIWGKRPLTIDGSEFPCPLEKLIKLDGFDTPLGLMSEKDWRDYYNHSFRDRYKIGSTDSVFEIGCGAGALLYLFNEAHCPIGGLDYAENLLKLSKINFSEYADGFLCADASYTPVHPAYDIVISNHVIHYFPSLSYARTVILLGLVKARKYLVIHGIPDAAYRADSEAFRKGTLSEEEHAKKYTSLSILYFERDWFRVLASEVNAKIKFFDHQMPHFPQNKFRYDIILEK